MINFDVKIVSTRGERHINKYIDKISWSSQLPGGFATASINLHKPIKFTPDEVELYARVVISKGLDILWEGTIEDLSASMDESGGVWELHPVGPQAITEDKTFPIIYVDRDISGPRWLRVFTSNDVKDGSFEINDGLDVANPAPTLMMKIPEGSTIDSASCVTVKYMGLADLGQNMALFEASWDTGVSSSIWWVRYYADSSTLVLNYTANTAGAPIRTITVGSDFTVGSATPYLKWNYTGGPNTIPSDNYWAAWKNIAVRATTYSKAGVEKVSGYSSTDDTIRVDDIVADVLGRVLTAYDGANATIAPTTYSLDQLAYYDGTTARQILDDMMKLEPAFYWAVWEKNPDTGKYRFEWSLWPTEVRYELSAKDGYSSSGITEEGLYNSVYVRWKDARGMIKRTIRTQSVPALGSRDRQGFIDLSGEVGTLANANQAGDAFLLEHNTLSNAGSVSISHSILDRLAGKMVEPYEIKPGGLVMIRDVPAKPDTLNTQSGLAGRDGQSIFRAVAVTYESDTNTSTLELDVFEPRIERAVAKLRADLNAKRRQ